MPSRGVDKAGQGLRNGVRGPGATASSWPPSFTPASIAGLVGWYDAALGVALNGSTVSAWGDQSSNGNNLSQGTQAKQPSYNATGGPNNGPYLGASGGQAILRSFTLAQPYEVFVIASTNWVASGAAQCMFDGRTLNGGKLEFNQLGGNALAIYAGTNGTVFLANASMPTPYTAWRSYDAQFNGASTQFTMSGAASTVGNAGANTPGGITLFSEGNGSANPFSGGIAFVAIYSNVLASSDRANLLAYMAAKGST
jgi:hypothetical protein